jgi:hypothetical protein
MAIPGPADMALLPVASEAKRISSKPQPGIHITGQSCGFDAEIAYSEISDKGMVRHRSFKRPTSSTARGGL